MFVLFNPVIVKEFYGMIKNSVEQLNEKILRVHGICSTPSALFLVTEFAPKGELDKFIAHERYDSALAT